MDAIPAAWAALCGLALLLGARHGFDADHLATIDGLARYNAHSHPRLARYAGLLFSLGHGAIVLSVAVAACAFASQWQTPHWLEITGAVISIAFLFALAALNVGAVLRTPSHVVVRPAGLKGRWLGRIVNVERAWAIAAVGALFALSFDTVSQTTLFALAAGRIGGMSDALFVAGLFVVGMVAVDGLNGLWISRLLRRADRTAVVASRIMALAVAAISFAIGVLALAKLLVPAIDAWVETYGLLLGAAVIAGVAGAFVAGTIAAVRWQPAALAPSGAD